MVSKWARTARALGLGLAAGFLTACASTPAPLAGAVGEEPPAPAPENFGNAPLVVDYAANLQCVPYARRESGVQIYGDANTWWRQAAGRYARSRTPAPGSVIAVAGFNDPGRGHVAVVRRIESDRVIIVDQANWLNGGEISVNVPVLDVSPNNDWSQIRVWHIPSGQWGGRVYTVEGFIHPFTLQAAAS